MEDFSVFLHTVEQQLNRATPREKSDFTAELAAHLCTIGFVVIAFLLGGSILVRQALIHRNILPALQVSDVVMYLPLPASGVFILIYEVANLLDDWKRETPAGEEVKKND